MCKTAVKEWMYSSFVMTVNEQNNCLLSFPKQDTGLTPIVIIAIYYRPFQKPLHVLHIKFLSKGGWLIFKTEFLFTLPLISE